MSKNLVFIASGGRTGTTFFGDLIGQAIEDAYSEHEPDLFAGFSALTMERIERYGFKHMIVDRALGLSGMRSLGMRFMTGKLSLEDAKAKLHASRAKFHAGIKENLVIESYGRWWMFAHAMDDLFPGSKMVGVVRDPRSWIGSWMSYHPAMGYVPWTHRFPPGPITPAKLGDKKNAARWKAIGPVGRLAWHWNLLNSQLLNAAQQRENAKIFKFEDLFSGEDKPLEELTEFVTTFPDKKYHVKDIAPLRSPPRNSSAQKKGDWEAWSDTERALVNEICGETMQACGYDPLPMNG